MAMDILTSGGWLLHVQLGLKAFTDTKNGYEHDQ